MNSTFSRFILSRYGLLSLAVLLFLFSHFFSQLYSNQASVTREVRLAEKYIHQQQHDFNGFVKDTALINWLLSGDESLKELTVLSKKKYSIFLYRTDRFNNAQLKWWNGQMVTPSAELVNAADGEYFSKVSNGWYCTVKKTLEQPMQDYGIIAIAMIPVQSEFFIETEYLPVHFFFSSSADKRVTLSVSPTEYPVKSLAGKILFWLSKKPVAAVAYNDWQTNLLKFFSVLLFFLALYFFIEAAARKFGAWKAVGLLMATLLVFRLVTYLFPSLFNLRQFELFSPLIYGSTYIQRSLGDLCINASLFCWIVIYAWSKTKQKDNLVPQLPAKTKWVAGILSLCLLILSTFTLASVVRSLVADSKISFDVTDFFGLGIYTVIGFALLACLSLSYYYFSRLLLRFITALFSGKEMFIYFFIAAAGLLYLTLRTDQRDVLFHLPVLCWLILYTWLINRKGIVINRVRVNIAGVLSWIFIFSVSIAAIMLVENKKAEWKKRERMADKLAVQTDRSSELLMNIATEYLDNDFLRDNLYRFNDAETGSKIRDSIIRNNYRGSLNKYDTRLYVFDRDDKPLHNEDGITCEALNAIINVQARPTEKPGLYFYETDYDRFSYITRREIKDSAGAKLGSFFIVSNLRSYSPDALLPELFRQYGKTDMDNSPVYSTAVYVNNQLKSQPGNYSFATSITEDEVPRREYESRTNGDFNELWYRYSTEKVIVIARKNETLIEAITLFSYIFCSFIFLVTLVRLLSFLFSRGFGKEKLKGLFQLNIRAQVHSTIIFVSVLSFLIIGAATISFFINRYYRNNSDKLSRTMLIMVNEMEKRMADHSVFDDVIRIYDSVSNNDLQKLVDDVSDIHGVDVNVYDLDGDLQVSSEGNVYKKGVLSRKMNPLAFYHLGKMRQVLHSQEEKIGNFSYLSIYSPVREQDQGGRPYAYINIPYFTSKPQLQQQISNFLVTIINLNAFIFLIGGLIALFITNRITSSFSVISDKMKEVNLGRMNEQIMWNRNDEIGELVKEYNKMVSKLGESAALLAKSEREGAWREMARQVAHEIKNPLTPMKLSIQYLQKAINNNHDNVKELTANVAGTLVEQIDHLSKIAADFSQFANIGNTHVELFDLHDVVASLKDLYQPNQQVELLWYPLSEKAMVNADKTQMNRLFTNLLTNAVQACPQGQPCHITIDEVKNEDKIIISVQDNGEGIPPEMQERIFVPNFTTKSSGTGLGLAMCKGIVEQAKGEIWFETKLGSGTTFYVSLPLAL
jgi:signal transduction histidine kinase